MAITGPIVPKQYAPPNSAAPTPDVNDAVAGEIITCTKTGRMWVKWLTNSQSGMLPIRPEWSFTNSLAETLSGVREKLVGNAPYQGSGVEIYGAGTYITQMNGSPGNLTAGTTNVGEFTAVGATAKIETAGTGNPGTIASLKPTLTNYGFTPSTVYWISANQATGAEIGYQASPSTTWFPIAYLSDTKCDFRKVVEANSGVKIPSIAAAYRLQTDASGNIITASSNPDIAYTLAGDVTLSTANTDTELGDLRFTIGLAGVTTRWLITLTVNTNHNNSHTTTFKARDHTASTDLVGSAYTSNGYGTGSVSTVMVVTGSQQIRIYVQSTGAGAVVKQLTSTGVSSTSITATRLA